jgi:hypothetical protein
VLWSAPRTTLLKGHRDTSIVGRCLAGLLQFGQRRDAGVHRSADVCMNLHDSMEKSERSPRGDVDSSLERGLHWHLSAQQTGRSARSPKASRIALGLLSFYQVQTMLSIDRADCVSCRLRRPPRSVRCGWRVRQPPAGNALTSSASARCSSRPLSRVSLFTNQVRTLRPRRRSIGPSTP